MAQALNPAFLGDTGSMAINDLLPERPALIGEFSPAYEAYRQVTVADLAPMTQYEYIQALQLVDLNWAILQLKASAQVELSTGTEKTVRQLLTVRSKVTATERDRQLYAFTEAGGDEDDFEDTVDWEAIELRIETLMSDLKSKDPVQARAGHGGGDLTRRRPKARAERAVFAELQLQPARARSA